MMSSPVETAFARCEGRDGGAERDAEREEEEEREAAADWEPLREAADGEELRTAEEAGLVEMKGNVGEESGAAAGSGRLGRKEELLPCKSLSHSSAEP